MENKYYIYLILDTRKVSGITYNGVTIDYQPFYVGKGKNNRINEHFRPSLLKVNNIKNNIIKRVILDTGKPPITCKIFEGLTEEEAFNKEIELIKFFGRIDKGTGILANHTDGGEGHSGYNKPKLYKRKVIYQYDLTGKLIKKWSHIDEAAKAAGVLNGNISTSIKRGGTCGGFIWSYVKILPNTKTRYQMPIKYTDIQQIDIKTNEVLKIFSNALEIEKELNLRSGARNKIYECLRNKLKTAYGYKWKQKK
jgi:hypothetical protein